MSRREEGMKGLEGGRETEGQNGMSESLSVCLSVGVIVYLLSRPPSLSIPTYCNLLSNL